MKIQRDRFSCGVFAVLNALRALGVKVSEKQVRQHTATARGQGTTEHGIRNALERFGCYGDELHLADKAEGFDVVHAHVLNGAPVLLYVDGDHWVTAVGACGDRLLIFDSENEPDNRAEHGVHVYDARKLARRWLKDRGARKLYGIVARRD